ncbi:DUF4902 domain-containing protein [Eleftheria terrae]|uniref:DUF4902 domain-containing protein n=1 Tax=Eleftheria terrae TaxID=1597781 RepID=UPI00263A85C0|nr:DUF4902 domain-containing protein [Eleftheria terrae]WKB51106.1 DUF4902 domain-containing protein [Eleftheria terrae]
MIQQTNFRHLFSGLDPECLDGALPLCGGAAAGISGYTEWVSCDEPLLSLGWDWRLDHRSGWPEVAAPGVRSNLMLVDEQGFDLGSALTIDRLNALLKTLDWQAAVAAALQMQRRR